MPRNSSAKYVPVKLRPSLTAVQRIKAPPELNDVQRSIFEEIVGGLPPHWFHICNKELMRHYAVQVAEGRELAKQLEAAKKGPDRRLERELRRDLMTSTKLINTLARSMRLTQQAVVDPKVAKHVEVQAPSRIWDDDAENAAA